MNKTDTGVVFIPLVTSVFAGQVLAQASGIKFNSNADDIAKIGNLVEEFRQDIIHRDGNALKKLMLNPNVLFHEVDNQEAIDKARKLNAQFDGIGPSTLDRLVTLLATSKDKPKRRFKT